MQLCGNHYLRAGDQSVNPDPVYYSRQCCRKLSFVLVLFSYDIYKHTYNVIYYI